MNCLETMKARQANRPGDWSHAPVSLPESLPTRKAGKEKACRRLRTLGQQQLQQWKGDTLSMQEKAATSLHSKVLDVSQLCRFHS